MEGNSWFEIEGEWLGGEEDCCLRIYSTDSLLENAKVCFTFLSKYNCITECWPDEKKQCTRCNLYTHTHICVFLCL